MVRQRESFLFFLSGTTCYFTFLGLVSFLILKSEARKTLQKILWDCIEYITSYLQGNILLTCIVLKMFFWFLKWTKYEWMEIFTNCFYIIFEIRKWCCHNLYFSLLISLTLISTSFLFLQQPILNFNLRENFDKPLRNMYDMSGRTDSVVLCDRVIEFSIMRDKNCPFFVFLSG